MISPAPYPTIDSLEPVLEVIHAGHQCLFLEGRSLRDLDVNDRQEVRPLQHHLRHSLHERFGMLTIQFNLALGTEAHWSVFSPEQRREAERAWDGIPLFQAIQDAANLDTPPYSRATHLFLSLYRSLERPTPIPPVCLLVDFAQDLAPNRELGGGHEDLLQISQIVRLIAGDFRRRLHPFVLILSGVPENVDGEVLNWLKRVALPQPDRSSKQHFLEVLRAQPRLSDAAFEPGLDETAIANLASRTPHASLEALMVGSQRTRRPITASDLVESKRSDVIRLSEGTLSFLDTGRAQHSRLVGRTVAKASYLLAHWSELLMLGDSNAPLNVMLCGAPSTAKTDLVHHAAIRSRTPCYSFISPKDGVVGGTERRARLQFRVFKDLAPAVGVIDEFPEAYPTQRNQFNGDSGASNAVIGAMLEATSDSSRAGKCLLFATTNCPSKIGSALNSRFDFVPVLQALEDDYPLILASLAEQVMPEVEWDPASPAITTAARILHGKGIVPRVIRQMLSTKLALVGSSSEEVIKLAAEHAAPQDPVARASAEYADLSAILLCKDLSWLPWHGEISNYPLPAYLRGIVSDRDGSVDRDRLQARIKELEPLANV
jgi:hypothetical protein